MHPFFLIGTLVHVTAIAVIGFFVLFAASKSDGMIRILGNLLAVWLFVLAVLVIVVTATAAIFGGVPSGVSLMDRMQHGWTQPWEHFVHPGPAAPESAPPAKK